MSKIEGNLHNHVKIIKLFQTMANFNSLHHWRNPSYYNFKPSICYFCSVWDMSGFHYLHICLHMCISRGENQNGVSDISPTLQEKPILFYFFTIVWSDFVYWFQLFIIKNCILMDDSSFASRKSSLRAFIWYIYSQVHKYWDIDTILTFLALYTTTMDFKWNEQDVL